MEPLRDLIARLADRDAPRSEATVQADIRTLLLGAPLHLGEEDLRNVSLESPVGDRRRIDVETGFTVLEVKRDLRRSGVRDEALQQLAGYVEARERDTERRYVGVLTDGAEWRCYYLKGGELAEASTITVRRERPEVDALLVWLGESWRRRRRSRQRRGRLDRAWAPGAAPTPWTGQAWRTCTPRTGRTLRSR